MGNMGDYRNCYGSKANSRDGLKGVMVWMESLRGFGENVGRKRSGDQARLLEVGVEDRSISPT